MKMPVWSLACQQSVFQQYQWRMFLRVLSTRWRRKPASIEITLSLLSVTLCIGRCMSALKKHVHSKLPEIFCTLQWLGKNCVDCILSSPIPWQPHSSITGLKPSFSANPFHRSLPFLLQEWLHGFPGLFTDTSEHSFLLWFFFSTFSCWFRAID